MFEYLLFKAKHSVPSLTNCCKFHHCFYIKKKEKKIHKLSVFREGGQVFQFSPTKGLPLCNFCLYNIVCSCLKICEYSSIVCMYNSSSKIYLHVRNGIRVVLRVKFSHTCCARDGWLQIIRIVICDFGTSIYTIRQKKKKMQLEITNRIVYNNVGTTLCVLIIIKRHTGAYNFLGSFINW